MTSPLPTTNLPKPANEFVGREAESESIGESLKAGKMVWLTGPPGVGKTRLAQEAAARLEEVDAWYVDAHGITDGDSLLAAICGVTGAREVEVATDLGWVLARRGKTVLVLDNVDEVTEPAVELGQALESEGVGVIATSRVVTAGAMVLAGLPAEAARELFVARTAEARDLGGVDSLVEHLSGLPLAIELAASQMDVMTPHALMKRMERDGGELLDGESKLDLAIRESWLRLDEAQKKTLAAAAVCGACSFDLDTLEAITKESAAGPLRALRAQSLLNRSVEHGEIRFRLYDSVREFVIRHASPDILWANQNLHVNYFAALALESWNKERTPVVGDAVRLLELERPSLEVALSYAQKLGLANEACHLALGLTLLFRFQDTLGPSVAKIEDALELEADSEIEFELFHDYAHVLMDLNDPAVAQSPVSRLKSAAATPRERSIALRSSARLLHHLGQVLPGVKEAELALEAATETEDAYEIAVSLRIWAGVAYTRAEHRSVAIQRLIESANIFRKIDAPHDEAMSQYMLVYALDEQAQPTRQRDAIERANKLFLLTADSGLALETKRLLGTLEGSLGRHEPAARLLGEVYDEALKMGVLSTARTAAEILFSVCIDSGDLEQADLQIHRQEELLARDFDSFGIHWLSVQRGRLMAHRGEFGGAIELLVAAIEEDALHWNPALQIWPRGVLLMAYLKSDHVEEAAALYEETLAISEKFANPEWSLFVEIMELGLAYNRSCDDMELLNGLSRIQANPIYSGSAEVRSLARLLSSGKSIVQSLSAQGDKDALLVSSDGERFRAPGADEWTDIGRRKRLVAVLTALIEARQNDESFMPIEDLISRVWPGETLTHESAMNRLRATISMLRKTGLGDVIVFEDGGYGIAPEVELTVSKP